VQTTKRDAREGNAHDERQQPSGRNPQQEPTLGASPKPCAEAPARGRQ
jgi:hypothetical protein